MSELKDEDIHSFAFQISSIDEILGLHNLYTPNIMDDIERRIESDPEPKLFKLYINFQFSKFGPYIVLVWWFCTILVGVFYGFDVLNLTVFSFSAPPGTDGYTADAKMKSEFSSVSDSRQLLIYYKCNTCNNQLPIEWTPHHTYTPNKTPNNYHGWILNNMGRALETWATNYKGDIFESYVDFYDTYFSYGLTKVGMPENQILAGLAQQIFVSEGQDSAIGILSYDNNKDQTTKNNFIDDLNDECGYISKMYGNGTVTMAMTGESALIKAMNEESRKDVEKKDTLTIPVALCVLALIIRSWRLMFIPLLTFGTSICASFSVMRPFAEYVLDVNPFCPSIMMSVTIAMSIDYSLFLLSRYREEVERNTLHIDIINKLRMIEISREAIRQTTRWSGKVIALSGCILSLTYFGLIFYPMQVLQSVGLGAGLAIVCTIIVNLTLTPALLLIFPYFFSQFGWAGCPCKRVMCCGGDEKKSLCWKSASEPLIINEENGVQDIVIRDAAPDLEVEEDEETALYAAVNKNDPCEKCWYHCGSKSTICPWSILISVIVYAAIAPIGWQFTSFTQQLADTLIFPRDSPYYSTYKDVVRDFSPGFIAPWYILIFKKDSQDKISSVTYSNYINDTGYLIQDVWDAVMSSTDNGGYNLTIEGIGFMGSSNVGGIEKGSVITESVWNDNITCSYINCSDSRNFKPCYKCNQANQTYQYLVMDKISDDATSSYYQMTTMFDPYYEHAISFVSDFRDWLSSACDKYGYKCYLTGGSIDEVDSVNKIYDSFPMVLGCIVAFVFCLMGIVFKSVFVPFRLFITIAVPMTFVYGLAVMVYEHGMLSSLNIDAFANTDGLYWLIPVMTVTILIGLALDYDIFLFARIYEYRIMGRVPTHESIVRGVYKTGSIITAAGIIMGIAFCGLLLSQITSLNQTGFIMVIAVLVDTFIIRTSLVPAVLSIAKEVNWWPGLNPKCLAKEELMKEMNDDGSPKHVNSQFSINAVQPLRTGNPENNTLDETM